MVGSPIVIWMPLGSILFDAFIHRPCRQALQIESDWALKMLPVIKSLWGVTLIFSKGPVLRVISARPASKPSSRQMDCAVSIKQQSHKSTFVPYLSIWSLVVLSMLRIHISLSKAIDFIHTLMTGGQMKALLFVGFLDEVYDHCSTVGQIGLHRTLCINL